SLLPPLETAFDLFLQLRERRLERGSIDFDLPEPQIVLDIEEGIATSIVKTSRNQAHMLIEEFMIAANEAVATFAADQEWPMIYRIHDFPDSEKIADFKNLAHGLGYALPPIDRLTPKHLASIVKEVQGKPHERLVNTLLLRSLKQAVYSPHNVGHFGLASEKYTHFTSPIRRYPDLIVHRRLHELLQNSSKTSKKKDHAITMQKLESMADHCSKMERNAMKAEWAVRDLHVALFMKDKVGEEYEGIISSVTKFGIFVEINDFFVEGLVPLYTILDDHYEFLEKHHELLGKKTKKRFKIGDAVKIRVVKSDIIMRRVEFEFVR
ncbi:MAG: RNB domain-containing ribonuclease, partial [Deltaproteobacteria bacterium]|nr:RNB domain-containing ribonuclease [Deltaproteobacteria bacterium]